MSIFKNKLFAFSLLLFLFSCNQSKKETSQELNKNINNKITVKKDAKKYSVYYELNLPFEILVNDMVVEKNLEIGMDGPDQINQFIIENGSQKIKIKAIHPYAENGGKIQPQDIPLINERLAIYLKDSTINDGKLQLITALQFPEIEEETPYIEHEWTFDAEVPFKLNGWANSKNLTQMDKEELKKKVIQKFRDLRNLLESGQANSFMKELKNCHNDFYTANYFDNNQIKEYESNLTTFYNEHKEHMILFEDNVAIKIMGDGKVVSLELIGHFQGQGVLTAIDKEQKTLYLNYVMLHIPKNSDELEIVRINSKLTSMDD